MVDRIIVPSINEVDNSLHGRIKCVTCWKSYWHSQKGVFGVALLSHVTDDEFNVRLFAVEKETFLRMIYYSSHPHPDNIQ